MINGGLKLKGKGIGEHDSGRLRVNFRGANKNTHPANVAECGFWRFRIAKDQISLT